jgi:Flp pilus assembly protein TadG
MNKHVLARAAAVRRLLSRIGQNRRGNVMMLLGFAMIPMVFGVGFGIDYSRAMKLRTRMNAAADAAALAAVNVTMIQQSDSEAEAAARAMFNEQVKGLPGMVYDTTNPNNPTIDVVSTGGVNTGRTVTVSYSARSTNIFAGILGVPTLPVNGSAEANATRAPNINFYLLMDTSPSMLLPATSDGIDALIRATKSSSKPKGCAFACHTQDPHGDAIYIRDKFYDQGTGKDIWVDNSGAWCAVRSVSSSRVTCNDYTQYYLSNGQYADTYWLTRNYAAVYGSGENITLRIDEEQAAAQNLIPFAITTASNNKVTYKLQLFTFNWTRTDLGNSHPVNTITSTMTDVNSLATYTVPNFYDVQQKWYKNGCPTSSTCSVDDKGTEVHNALARMNTIMPTPGDGTTTNNPQEVLFIITDGVVDEDQGGRRHREWSSVNLADCTTIKNRGIRIAILYTEYLPDSLDGDSWSESNVQPYLPNVEGQLKSCASARTDGTPLYYKVTTDQSISEALAALFSLTVQSAHLTK